jgi:triacylglycerol esterase/lipase EstA (alpha/beta hydrolase family)
MRVAIAAAAAVMLGAAGVATAAPTTTIPVPYNFPANLGNQLTDPTGSPPGTNDWSCKPSAAHPDPVVLVHGGFASPQVEWGTLGPVLHNAGYCVYALAWGGDPLPAPFSNFGGYRSVKTVGAPALSTFVQRVLRSTGAGKVSLVSHSFGSLVDAYYTRYLGGAEHVSAVISLAGLYRGVTVPDAMRVNPPGCAVCTEPLAGSELVRAINAGGNPYLPDIRYTNVVTQYDDTVSPYTSGVVAGRPGQQVTNIVVQHGCPQDWSNHQAIIVTRRTSAFVLNGLDPAHPVQVPCETVIPSYGAVR